MTRLTKLDRSVAGRVAIVTGAASGMGRATAHLLADEGARVAVTDVHREGVDAVVGEITAAGGTAVGWALDLRRPEEIDVVVQEVVDRLGPVDILVHNAGVSLGTPIADEGWEDAWAATFAVNLTAQARMVRACLPWLLRDGEGRVVNIASTEGLGATAGATPSKASIISVASLR